MEEVYKNELVQLPDGEVSHVALEEHPTKTREWSRSLEKETNYGKKVSLPVVVGGYTVANKTEAMVDEEKRVERSKVDIGGKQCNTLEGEESKTDVHSNERGYSVGLYYIFMQSVIKHEEPETKQRSDETKKSSNKGKAPEDLLFGP